MKYLIFILFALASCSQNTDPDIEVINAWIREVPPGSDVTALYLDIKNNGGEDAIVSISSPVSDTAEIHSTEINSDGIAKMVELENVAVPANGVLNLKPGGKHIMLIGLKEPLKPGDVHEVKLNFKSSGEKSANAEVKGFADGGGDHGMHH